MSVYLQLPCVDYVQLHPICHNASAYPTSLGPHSSVLAYESPPPFLACFSGFILTADGGHHHLGPDGIMFHACEGAPRVIDDGAFHCGQQCVEDAHAVVKGQSHHQALLWQIAHMGNGSVVHPTACQPIDGLQEERKGKTAQSSGRGGGRYPRGARGVWCRQWNRSSWLSQASPRQHPSLPWWLCDTTLRQGYSKIIELANWQSISSTAQQAQSQLRSDPPSPT